MKTGDRVLVPFAIGCGECEYCRRDMWSLRGAERVVAIDRIPERLAMAQSAGNVIVIDYTQTDNIVEAIKEATDGDGADHCIDAVGMEAHGTGLAADYDKVKQTFRLESDRPTVLRQAIQACRKGGTVSIPGVYSGLIDKLNIGAAFAKGLTLKMGQTHVHRYVPELMRRIEQGQIDPSFVITHRLPLDEAPRAYRLFRDNEDSCIKVVLNP